MLKKVWISALALGVVAFGAWRLSAFHTHARPILLPLSRGNFQVLQFLPKQETPSALVLFASGDGGWSSLEEAICHGLQKHGCEVFGIDSTSYARTDYNLATLQADFSAIARAAEAAYREHPLPLIVGGYSMGAAQAIAVAGGPHPPHGLMALLLVDPRSRGRYGLRTEDQMNVLPTGPGTFAVADFGVHLHVLRVVQWHAQRDVIDSCAWLAALAVPHQEDDFPGTGHGYRHNRDQFVREVANSVDWLLQPLDQDLGRMTAGSAKP